MQVLGPADDEHVPQLNELRIVDDEMEIDTDSTAMPVDENPTPESQDLEIPTSMGQLERGTLRLFHQVDEDDIETSGEGKTREDEVTGDIGQDVEQELHIWRNAGHPEENAQNLWRRYEALTHDLAYTLCEQLRLVLEPSLATRLKGDYRSGKRLNMKKIIAYIASDYTKDKIWLRRTKPSQREYQVLISLDDSRSMADSHCIHLAYQTLALISKALSRLESGDIAIARFGETVDMLRGLDEGPFTEKVGKDIINAFRFTQKATNVLSLMEKTLIFLESARERKAMTSASATELWQLQIIISDGVCQDHEKLRTVLRKAEERRVMVVFIILDSMKSASTERGSSSVQRNDSILEMKKVDFKIVEGKMELQHKKYLDSFPFNYYLVLRNVESLPDVLAETLKQFFERISER
jgi:midasin